MVEFALRLRQLRKDKHLTQAQVASRIGVTPSMVSSYETDIRLPSYDVMMRIADVFGVTVDYLLQDGHTDIPKAVDDVSVVRHRNHMVITALSVLLAWFLATSCFVILDILGERMVLRWLPFLSSSCS